MQSSLTHSVAGEGSLPPEAELSSIESENLTSRTSFPWIPYEDSRTRKLCCGNAARSSLRTARRPGAITMLDSRILRGLAFAAASTIFADFGLLPCCLQAGEMHSVSLYPEHQALSNDPMYRWAAAVQRTDSLGLSYASAVMIAPDLFINSGHYTPRDGSLVASLNELVFGANYHTSTDRWEIESTKRFPGYVFGDTSTIDLGIGWTKEFVNGFDTPVEFASVMDWDVLTNVEYGNYGDMSTGELPSLGDRLAGRAPVYVAGLNSYPAGRYFATYFTSSPGDYLLNSKGLNYSSGSPWFSPEGALAGVTIAKSNALGGGFTTALNLTNPEVQTFLQPYIQDSWHRYYSTTRTPGDANGDGVVDGADYTLWADHYLATGRMWPEGDFTGDGIVDGADYTIWADHYAPAQLALAAVPEPSTLGLLTAGCVVVLAARMRRRFA